MLTIAPYPFGGVAVPLSVRARRIPARRDGSDAEVRQALAQAPDGTLTGLAVSGPATAP